MKRKNNKYGFTLVELLTTLAVIGVLLGLLIPALNQVSKTATKIKQKAQFHAIGTALEAFRNDYGDYPPSEWDPNPNDDTDGYVYGFYSASQRLAEAIIGRDGLGFHPSSQFTDDGNIEVWGGFPPASGPVAVYSTAKENIAARKGPYLELENANAVTLENLYGDGNHGSLYNSYVLADMYKITKNFATGKMTGSPILYYKANKLKIGHGYADAAPDNSASSTYNIKDSLGPWGTWGGLAALNSLVNGGEHPLKAKDPQLFYTATANPNFPGPPKRPYRAESFILHSAGPDGLYGTTDDLFNFETEK